MPQRILAVELAGNRVRAAVAERSWNSFQFIGVFEGQRASDEPDLSAALARLVQRSGTPDIVVSALPSQLVAKRLLELPFADSRRLNQVVPFALEEHLPFAVDGAIVAFARVGRDDSKALVLAAFARKQDVQHHLDLLHKAGLDPKTVTLAPYALAALFARARNGAEPRPHLVVETDDSSTSVVLMDAAGIPRAMRTIGLGLIGADGSLTAPNEAAPVLNALRQTMLAHAADVEPHDLIVTGPGAAVPRVRSLLADALAVVVREAGEFDCSAMFEGRQPDTTRFAAAVAMLLGELPARPVELLNFRQAEFAFRGRTRGDLTPFYTTLALAAGLAFVALLHFGLGVATNLHRLSLLNTEIGAVAAPALGETNPSEPMQQLRSGVTAMTKRLRLIGGNLSRNSPLDTLLAVSQALPARFPVQMEDLEIDAAGLKVTGQADSFATVDQVKRALDASGQFGPIEVTHAKAGSDADKVEFRLSAEFRYGGSD
jgi:Type IV pilus assembly protein PilM